MFHVMQTCICYQSNADLCMYVINAGTPREGGADGIPGPSRTYGMYSILLWGGSVVKFVFFCRDVRVYCRHLFCWRPKLLFFCSGTPRSPRNARTYWKAWKEWRYRCSGM